MEKEVKVLKTYSRDEKGALVEDKVFKPFEDVFISMGDIHKLVQTLDIKFIMNLLKDVESVDEGAIMPLIGDVVVSYFEVIVPIVISNYDGLTLEDLDFVNSEDYVEAIVYLAKQVIEKYGKVFSTLLKK